MKSKFFALVGIFLATTLVPSYANTHPDRKSVSPSNYVVIGAFAFKKNAMRFTTRVNKHAEQIKGSAKYELNVNRNLYYVYVLNTPDHELALQEATRLRRETEYKDAWVYNGSFQNEESPNVDINPETKQPIEQVTQNDNPGEPVVQNEQSPVSPYVEVVEGVTEESIPDEAENSKQFLFRIYRAVDNEPVEGDVNVVDAVKSRKLGSYKGNEPVTVSMPSGSSKKLALICDVFGYRKVQRDIDFNARMDEDISVEDHSIVVPFELVRLQKGDIAIMYNVYFFKDAAIMRPESRYEVNSLLDMLNENPKYKIRIHGHTNGSAAGKIISMGDSKNFFSLTGTREGAGSAKKLSEERAKVIKEYLIENGINESRMQIKAWGGKRPIHDKHSNRAQENVRVEIEILEN